MNVLLFDTETTGLPSFNLPLSDPSQPHLVELAAELLEVPTNDPDGAMMIEAIDDLVSLPEGVPMPPAASAIHGITEADLICNGIPLNVALLHFFELVRHADVIASFNLQFDAYIVKAAAVRAGLMIPGEIAIMQRVCVMTSATKIVAAQFASGRSGKFPRLSEAFETLCGEPLVGAHSAMGDTRAARRVLLELVRRGAVVLRGRSTPAVKP